MSTSLYVYVTHPFLSFEMSTVRGQQHSFSTHGRVFLRKWQRFWDRKYLNPGGSRTPNLRIHIECSTVSATGTGHSLYHVFVILALVFIDIFVCKVNIWNVNCARATSLIFDSQRDILEKVMEFLRLKVLRTSKVSNPQTSDSCRILKPYELPEKMLSIL